MIEFFQHLGKLMDDHWFLAWCALWLLWVPGCLAVTLPVMLIKLCERILRSLNIFIRGWPPAHLNADGDPIQWSFQKANTELPKDESSK